MDNQSWISDILGTPQEDTSSSWISDILGPQATLKPQAQLSGLPSLSSGSADPQALIQKYFPQSEWERAANVMKGESGGRADAVGDNFPINGQTIPSYGLFQIRALPGRPAPEQLIDPEFNVKYAAQMFNQQGWHPWTAARKLGYTQ